MLQAARWLLWTLLAALAAPLPAGGTEQGEREPGAAPAEVLEVYASFYPVAYFAERIGGDAVRVVCPLPEDADPIFWKPSRGTVRAFQEADLVLLNGAGFEKWADYVNLPVGRTVRTARVFREDWIQYEETLTHRHGPEGEHTHSGIDGHTWLDPHHALSQAGEVRDALVKRLPERRPALEERFVELADDFHQLDAAFRALRPLEEGQTLVASHPAYNYPARRYGWPIVNLDLDPGRVPDAAELEAAHHALGERRARVLLWESAPAPEVAAAVERELGWESVVFSPCELLGRAERRRGEDYLTVMRANVERLAAALAAEGD